MFILKNEIQFDMAHYLSDYSGKCSNIHGHRYRLIVKTSSDKLHEQGQLRGMVDDFSTIKQRLKEIEDFFDHKLIIEDNQEGRELAAKMNELKNDFKIKLMPFRPTAEEMARCIYRMLKDKGLNISEVELFETPTNSCVYFE